MASNENLQDAFHSGKFREDLYHRFNEFAINIPALRNRKEDIPLFAEFFLQKRNKELGKQIEGFDSEAIEGLHINRHIVPPFYIPEIPYSLILP